LGKKIHKQLSQLLPKTASNSICPNFYGAVHLLVGTFVPFGAL
jgi:hypothetical protein